MHAGVTSVLREQELTRC